MRIETAFGEQACGDVGYGRMLEPDEVFRHIASMLPKPLLKGKKVLLTVGATREYIDAVRYLSNASSGKMGFKLAEVCYQSGAEVTMYGMWLF